MGADGGTDGAVDGVDAEPEADAGADADTDVDGGAACGDGVVSPPELCDTGIAPGSAGGCPTSCEDGVACTADRLEGEACLAECIFEEIEACADGDGCCPARCNTESDGDCSPSCGNGVVEPPETCDTAISSGDGACPSSCSDGVACTTDSLVGSGCSTECSFTPISACADGDGCCPSACDAVSDSDCSPSCGNGVVEPPETCDTAIAAMLEHERTELCGPRYKHNTGRKASRGGTTAGRLTLGGRTVPMRRPRVVDNDGDEIPLETWQQLREASSSGVTEVSRDSPS